MYLMFPAGGAELLQLQPLCHGFLVFRFAVILAFALGALHGNDFAHADLLFSRRGYSMISVTVPAPTVRPPSRMANLSPLSMATGVISSITNPTLSPGITISVPAGSSVTPVTSVVRK